MTSAKCHHLLILFEQTQFKTADTDNTHMHLMISFTDFLICACCSSITFFKQFGPNVTKEMLATPKNTTVWNTARVNKLIAGDSVISGFEGFFLKVTLSYSRMASKGFII